MTSRRTHPKPPFGADDLHCKLSEVIDELVLAGVPLEQARREFERQYVIAALAAQRGGVSRAAECIGVHRNTLRNKVTALGIRPAEYLRRSER